MIQILQTIGVILWVMLDAVVVFGPIILLCRYVMRQPARQYRQQYRQQPRPGYGAAPYANRWAYEHGYSEGFQDGQQYADEGAPFGFDTWEEFFMAEETFPHEQ